MLGSWRDALMRLHVSGWDSGDIDAACETLIETCEEDPESQLELATLGPSRVREILGTRIADDEVAALLQVAAVRSSQGAEGQALRDALYDLDAFAFDYAGVE